MNIPFWPFKTIKRLNDQLIDADESWSALALDNMELRRALVEANEKLVAQDAALLVVAAVDRLTDLVDRRLCLQTNNVVEALKGVQHSVGAVATAQDKASNVQREWLEVSKGNR